MIESTRITSRGDSWWIWNHYYVLRWASPMTLAGSLCIRIARSCRKDSSHVTINRPVVPQIPNSISRLRLFRLTRWTLQSYVIPQVAELSLTETQRWMKSRHSISCSCKACGNHRTSDLAILNTIVCLHGRQMKLESQKPVSQTRPRGNGWP